MKIYYDIVGQLLSSLRYHLDQIHGCHVLTKTDRCQMTAMSLNFNFELLYTASLPITIVPVLFELLQNTYRVKRSSSIVPK